MRSPEYAKNSGSKNTTAKVFQTIGQRRRQKLLSLGSSTPNTNARTARESR